MGRARSDGCDLYYEEIGEGTPILLIHPAGATASTRRGRDRGREGTDRSGSTGLAIRVDQEATGVVASRAAAARSARFSCS